MSNRQLEDMYEENHGRYIAKELGITYEELGRTNFEIHDRTTNDDMVIGNYIQFSTDSPKEVLDKIEGLDNYCVDIYFESEPEDDRENEESDQFNGGNIDPEADRIAEEQMYRIAEENRKKRLEE